MHKKTLNYYSCKAKKVQRKFYYAVEPRKLIKMCLLFRLVFLLGMVSDVGLQKPLFDEAMQFKDIVQGRLNLIY